MFFAINKKTNERIHSIAIFKNASYQTPYDEEWIADPDEIANWDEIKDKFPEIKVVYVQHKEFINFKGTKVLTAPHFRIPNATKLGINIKPESREHKIAKNWIYQRLIDDDLQLFYSSVNKPFRAINPIKLSELPIDLNKLSIETRIRDIKTQIADVILPFIKTHDLLGNGIVFEIQFSRQRESTKENRTLDWIFKGFSICWIYREDFDNITDVHIQVKNPILKISAYQPMLKWGGKQSIKNLRYASQEQSRLFELKEKEVIANFSKELEDNKELFLSFFTNMAKEIKKESIGKEFIQEINQLKGRIEELEEKREEETRPTCPKCSFPLVPRKGQYGYFWGCSNYSKDSSGCKYHMDMTTKEVGKWF